MANSDKFEIYVEDTSGRTYMGSSDLKRRVVKVGVDDLKSNLREFTDQLSMLLNDFPLDIGDFSLDQIQLSAEINGEGKIGILGTGVNVGASTGLTFTLKRS